eukprot:scaffold4900_cov193-Alexandrium_tamarense.AAC.19
MNTPATSHRVLATADCGGCNTGQCISPVDTTGQITGVRPSCQCKGTGFIGEHCEIPCSKQCQNGGKCVPASEASGGEETCSCTKAVVDGNPFAGLECEYGATVTCVVLGGDSTHSFCTNDGECRDIVGDNEMHKDCMCQDGFEGAHCEYVAGTIPDYLSTPSITAAQSSTGGSYNNSSVVSSVLSDTLLYSLMAVVSLLIGVLILSFYVRARRRKAADMIQRKRELEATEELAMMDVDDESENGII